MKINNVTALSAFNVAKDTAAKIDKTIKALTTGFKINEAADDSAGMEISESMRAQIGGLDKAVQNAQDGISLLQTAESALEGTTDIIHRMRELSTQAASGTLTQQDRDQIQLEIDQLKKEINRIASTTQFNKKKLLNGEMGLLWSSSDDAVRASASATVMNDDTDFEGNYELDITVEDHGQAQVQKSSIINVKTIETVKDYQMILINEGTDSVGKTSGAGWTFSEKSLNITKDGTYYISGTLDAAGHTQATDRYIKVDPGVKATIVVRDVYINAAEYAFDMNGATVDLWIDPGEHDNVNIFRAAEGRYHTGAIQVGDGAKLTISSMGGDFSTTGKLLAEGSEHGAGIGSSCHGASADAATIIINGGTIEARGGSYASGIGGGNDGGVTPGFSGSIEINGGYVTAIGGEGGAGIGAGGRGASSIETFSDPGSITIRGGTVIAQGGEDISVGYGYPGLGAGIGGGGHVGGTKITIDNDANVTATGFTDANQPESIGYGQDASEANVSYGSLFLPDARQTPEGPNAITSRVYRDSLLSEIDSFYSADGRFLLDDPQTLTITQGDGKQASVTLYASDTMYSVADKINNAIAKDLGQEHYVSGGNKFCTISDGSSGDEGVNTINFDENNMSATMLVRSALAGRAGELTFSGSQEMLDVLGLNTIRDSKEATFKTTIRDAHSGEILKTNVKTTGSVMRGVIAPSIDIEIDTTIGTEAKWNDKEKRYVFADKGTKTVKLHLKENGLNLQTGAYQGDKFTIAIGNMSTEALGLDAVSVSSQEMASRSLSILDNALDKVTSQRARLGAAQNALEHVAEKLTVESRNMNAAESRIKDADMANLMMKFTKLNIRLQANTAILGQANQTSQQVLSLMR